jgi:tetratricopeptide (TPR) repeat protein
MQKETAASKWAQGVGEVAQRAAQARAEELTRVARRLQEALIEEDRAEILAQFDRAVVLFAKEQRWHDGLTVAREVYDAVTCWAGFDPAPYAVIVAQFAHNYAIELQQARLFAAAEEFYAEALRLFQTYGDSLRVRVTAHQLGRAQQAQGKYAKAEQSYRASLEIARAQSDQAYIARNLFQLGQVAHLTGQPESSACLYREVLALADSTSSAPLWTAAAHQLGLLAQTRGEYAEAKDWFERALEHARGSGDARGMADALHQLGMVAHEQGDCARAAELYRASLANADETTDTAPTLYQLAQAAHACGDGASAEAYGRESLSLFQAQGDLDGIRRVQNLLRRLALARAAVTPGQSASPAEGSMHTGCLGSWTAAPIRILLADDHANVRAQVCARLSRESDFEIVAEASNSPEAIERALAIQPEIVLIDPIMQDGLGLQTVREVAVGAPESAIVVLIAYADTALQMELRKLGVRRIVNKGIESARLVAMLREIGQKNLSY